ncbi:MAG: hypothetical protein FJ304_18490 [Planctomycetes bacterium]|nr:hypothetical protein [Planctomycetota bacterium]
MTEPTSLAPLAPTADAPPAVLPLVRLLPPPPDGAILAPPGPPEPPRRGWLLAQLWAEFRLALKMYFDPRYRLSRTAQVALPLVAVLLVLNYFVFALWVTVPVLSPVAERLLAVVLVVLAYRVLASELDRYRTVLDYLARYSR